MHVQLYCLYPDEAAVLSALLQQIGFTVRFTRQIEMISDSWNERPYDLLLFCLTDEKPIPLRQIQQLREISTVPIIVIADQLSERKLVRLFEIGADIVVVRPYGIRLLGAQIKAFLRRVTGTPYFSIPILSQGGIVLDPSNRTVQVKKAKPRRLTQLEFRLIYTLMTHPGQIFPSENLVEHVWGYSGEGNKELVRGLIQRLRSKIEPEPRNPIYILTETGVGYFFKSDKDSI